MRPIVLVEDSERYIEEFTELVASELSVPAESFEVVRTEAEFHSRVRSWEAHPPAVFVVDVMFPYMEAGQSDADVPPEIREQAAKDRFYRAGVRCVNHLLRNETLAKIPIIIHSILDAADLEKDAMYRVPDLPNVMVCRKEAGGYAIIGVLESMLRLGAS